MLINELMLPSIRDFVDVEFRLSSNKWPNLACIGLMDLDVELALVLFSLECSIEEDTIVFMSDPGVGTAS